LKPLEWNKMFDLCLVTDEKLCLGRSLFEVVQQAAEGGVTMVQLREKDLNTKVFIERALTIKEILKPFGIPLIINDRVDVALAAEADGVHIGQNDMPYKMLRKIIPKKMLVGLSVETMDQAVEAENYKIDYLGVSPVFPTPTKTSVKTHWGIEGLQKLRSVSRHPLVAIGNINTLNAAQVIEAGADGIAVVSAICSAADPKSVTSELLSIIKKTKSYK